MPPGAIPWHRRLSVRLALVMVATMLAFDALSPYLYQRAYELLDLPDPSLDVSIVDTSWIFQTLLDGAQQQRPGVWIPDPDTAGAFENDLRQDGLLSVWLDAERHIRAKSQELPWTLGSLWNLPLDPIMEIPLPGVAALSIRATTDVAHDDDGVAGYLISLLYDEQLHAENHGSLVGDLGEIEDCQFNQRDDLIFATEEEFEAWRQREQRVQTVLETVVLLGTALLLALVTSRLITRRLSRLARLASQPMEESDQLPGPFDARGHDEIAALAAAMNARRDTVQELMAGLAEQDSRRRTWVAQVSHDLRTPLTALLACLDRSESALAHEDIDELRDAVRQLIAVALLDAGRVNTMADDLLDIARLEASDALDREPVPSGELVRKTVQLLEPMASAADVSLRAEIEPGLPVVSADGRRLCRALENLVRNAIDHAASAVTVAISNKQDALRFEVRDDGPGLPEHQGRVDLDHLGERRPRGDSAGLGLTVTRRVAAAHGGTVGAFNRPEGGAVVWFAIPLDVAV